MEPVFACLLQSTVDNPFFNRKSLEYMSLLAEHGTDAPSGSFVKSPEFKIFLVRMLEDIARLVIDQKTATEEFIRVCHTDKKEAKESFSLLSAIAELVCDDDVRVALDKAAKKIAMNAKDALKRLDS